MAGLATCFAILIRVYLIRAARKHREPRRGSLFFSPERSGQTARLQLELEPDIAEEGKFCAAMAALSDILRKMSKNVHIYREKCSTSLTIVRMMCLLTPPPDTMEVEGWARRHSPRNFPEYGNRGNRTF
jgi:hypothetical protein